MIALFSKGYFIDLWQEQQDPAWLQNTATALGVRVDEIELYNCPAIRSDMEYYFNSERQLVLQEDPALYPDDAEPGEIIWAAPITLEKIF